MAEKLIGSILHSGRLYANGKSIGRLQRLLDILIIGLIFYGYQPRSAWTASFVSIPTIYIVITITAILLPKAGIYKSYRHKTLNRMLQRINSTWFSVVCFVVLATFLNKSSEYYSRIAMTAWALSSWIWLISTHILSRMYLRSIRRIGLNSRTVLYWGDPQAAYNFSNQLLNNPWMGYKIVAWFSPVIVEEQPSNLPKCLGGIDELKKWCDKNSVNCIVFSNSSSSEKISVNQNIFNIFGNTCSRVLYAPDWYVESMRFECESIGNQHCIEIWGAKQTYDEIVLKRLFDLTISMVGIVVILPALIAIAIGIKLSSRGPILFRQKRCGLDGKTFVCYKFRSMYVDTESKTSDLKQATKDDPRVTSIGKFLRRWSLDELPQLLNVVLGDMSLVGPRPHALEHDRIYRELITGYTQRHVFKPGMTGLAQVSGYRGETKDISAMQARIEADLEYQKDWSLIVDIEILFRTIFTLASSEAY
ncbi:undecaprenyl-phosphate glucose phosphotransferase [Synechococcus sp. RS9902]|nr:undecaprenyl-phosphate glucose phosphotransferase [Synechococcus sp. RS9902]